MSDRFDHWIATFKRMAEFVDEQFDSPTKWKPSELLVIGFSMIWNGPKPEKAEAWATMMLTKARQRYREGFIADPFAVEPVVRKEAP